MYGDLNRILIFLHFGAFDGESKSIRGGGVGGLYFPQENLVGYMFLLFFFPGATAPSGLEPPFCRGFTTTLRHATLVRTPLNE